MVRERLGFGVVSKSDAGPATAQANGYGLALVLAIFDVRRQERAVQEVGAVEVLGIGSVTGLRPGIGHKHIHHTLLCWNTYVGQVKDGIAASAEEVVNEGNEVQG